MKKSILLYIIIMFIMIFPMNIDAATKNTTIGKDLNLYQCTSEPYQDKMLSTSTNAYFSSCMQATCSNGKYQLKKYSNNKVNCLNGNTDPYVKLINSGCVDYLNSSCSNEIKYCSQVMFYDCSKKSNGLLFTTTTKTTKTTKPTTTKTTKSTTTTTTTTSKIVTDSRLQSLSLSNGSISFNPDVYEYNIMVGNDVSNITVNAVAIDKSSTVSVSGNQNIEDGSEILITVKTIDDKLSTYMINVSKKVETILSSNNKLGSLNIVGYSLPFNSSISNYTLIIDSNVNSLDISYEVEDNKSNVVITGNENLEDGSTIIITVTAEDGSENDYLIDIIVKKKSNILYIIFIIIVILALGAGAFYVYKKFFQGKSGDKYEYE